MDPFKLPAKLSDVEDLAPLLEAALAEYGTLSSIADAELTDEQIDQLEYLSNAVDEINAENTVREEAVAARTERVAAAKSRLDAAAVPEEETATETETGDEAADEAIDAEVEGTVVPDDASEITEKETVTASASTKKPIARRVAAASTTKTEPVVDKPSQRATIVASAGLRDFAAGDTIIDMEKLTEAFMSRITGMPKGKGGGQSLQAFGVAKIQKNVAPEFQLLRGEQEKNQDKITAAAKAWRREGNSLTAAGGWCAPSETVYNLTSLETVSGILQLPEVTLNHGGISFTKGPDFSDIYTGSGFLQTEAQAEAGTAKNFIDVECPAFEEVRLDAIGYGVRAGILTNAAWPELIRRYVEGTLVAHAHKVNASKINRIVALAGAAINATEYGSAVVDSLSALAMQAERLRYKFRLDHSTKLEGFAPAWLLEVFRQDLAYQNGVDRLAVTDEQINSYLAVRKISLQWVYDWQDLAPTGVTWPATVDITLYPAGTYVAGTSDVISLDAVYDTASLTVNTYTAAFFEEGIAVFNPVANGVVVQIALAAYGRTGAADITNLVAGP